MDLVTKWDAYHGAADLPPWESNAVFAPLPAILQSHGIHKDARVIDLGSGACATAMWLSTQPGFHVTAVDISAKAIERAVAMDSHKSVRWVVGNVLDLPEEVVCPPYDLVFDMQCYHFLRDIDKASAILAITRCIKPSGIAVIVVGAPSDVDTTATVSGPCRLSREEFVGDFAGTDLRLLSLSLERFNPTIYYAEKFGQPPPCWVAVFGKV